MAVCLLTRRTHACTLNQVNLANMGLGDFWGGERIAAILDSNASLTDLALDSNGLTGASGEAIFRALGANMGLKALSLARNPIGVSDSELTD